MKRSLSRTNVEKLTCEDMILLVWTAMLYSDEPIVRVLTVPAFRLVSATEEFNQCNLRKAQPQYLAESI